MGMGMGMGGCYICLGGIGRVERSARVIFQRCRKEGGGMRVFCTLGCAAVLEQAEAEAELSAGEMSGGVKV
jgi:phage terminase large subunit GpA-like protein